MVRKEGKEEKFEVGRDISPLKGSFFLFFSLSPARPLAQLSSLFHPRFAVHRIKWVFLLEDFTRARDFPFNNFPKLFSLPFRADLP